MSKSWLLAILCMAVFTFHSFGQTFRLQGTVRDSATQKTIENVVIEVIPGNPSGNNPFNTVSNTKGEFTLALPSGSYQFTMRVLGYNTTTFNVEVKNDSQREFPLTAQPIPLGEIVVSSLRVNHRVKELPTPLAVVSANDYREQSSLTLSNVLATEPGIALGSDGIWATNINIHGMNENRLVTLIDGNRVETATDLTASLSMVDVNDIEQVEVIKGAQSSLYGTGAMGGIVNIITKDGHFASKPYLSGNIISGYASANELKTGHADVNAGANSWYLRVSGTYTDANNMCTPEGDLPNSQFTTNNFAARVGVKPFKNHLLKVQYQRNWSTDVGIPGGAAFSASATATYTDISRDLLAASYEITNITDRLSSLKLSYFTQFIKRDVEMLPNTYIETLLANGSTRRTTPTLVTPIGEHLTHGAQLQSIWKLSGNNTLIAGVDAWGRWLNTEREKDITVEVINTSGSVVATNSIIRGETPIPESSFKSAGIFVQDESHLLNDKLTLIAGGRIDGVYVENEKGYDVDYMITNGVETDITSTQKLTFEEGSESGLSWSANAGLLYKLFDNVDASLNLARSFRSPSLEERFKYIDLSSYVQLGNPNLDPEKGYSFDLGLRVWKPRFNLQVGVFSSWISDMIVQTSDEIIYTLTTGVTDTLPALINSNVSSAHLYGMDLATQVNVYKGLVLFGSGAYVRGKDTESDSNLPQIPPLNGRLGVRYTLSKIGTVETTLVGAAKQDKIADGETETDGYTRFDLAFSTAKFSVRLSKLQLFAGIDNVTDRSYTNHLSTNRGDITIEPGRNIYVRLYLSF